MSKNMHRNERIAFVGTSKLASCMLAISSEMQPRHSPALMLVLVFAALKAARSAHCGVGYVCSCLFLDRTLDLFYGFVK